MESDPRVYFAAERTLLAWVRTGVAVVGLGFIVARFGLLVKLVAPSHPDASRVVLSSVTGGVLALAGAVFTGLAALQFLHFLRKLAPHEKPRTPFSATLALLMAWVICAGGLVLGVVLLFPADPVMTVVP